MNTQIREFYATPGPMTETGEYQDHISKLPRDAGKLAHTVHGLVVHRFLAQPFYDLYIPQERQQETNIRQVTGMLDTVCRATSFSSPVTPGRRAAKVN